MSILRKGNINEDVAEMQRALMALDPKYKAILTRHSNKADDGNFGNDTEAAVKQFQKDTGLKPTGMVDDSLRDALATGFAIARKLPPLDVVEQETKREVTQALARAREQAVQVPKWNSDFMGPKLVAGIAIARMAESQVGLGETRGPNQGEHIDRFRGPAGNNHDGSAWCAEVNDVRFAPRCGFRLRAPARLSRNFKEQVMF